MEQLPEDIKNKIDEQADKYGFRVPYDGSNNFYNDDRTNGFQDGAVFGYSLAQEEVEGLKKENEDLRADRKHILNAMAIGADLAMKLNFDDDPVSEYYKMNTEIQSLKSRVEELKKDKKFLHEQLNKPKDNSPF